MPAWRGHGYASIACSLALMQGERVTAAAIGVAVFLSGAVLLGLEITASRVLAPTFGNSLFVWGALIGVVLTGLAIGYWVGGALADRIPSPYLLVGSIALGAVLVISIPLADEWVLEQIVTWDPGPRLDPLLAATILFGPASVVLASASPIAVRLVARSLERLGRTAGRLFSISTAGSIAGTFVTAFWLVPELGTDQVLAAGAVTLLVAALVVSLAVRLIAPAGVLAAGAVGALAITISLSPEQGGRLAGVAAQNWSPVYRQQAQRAPGKLDPATIGALGEGLSVRVAKDTRYHRMLVVDDSDSRYLRFDSSYQSGMWLDAPYRTRFQYTDYLDLGIAYNPGAKRVLFIGLGGGSAPKRFWRDFPALSLQVVELDPDVVDAAYRWFALPRDRRLRVDVEDGRRWLDRHAGRWDVIVVDAFYADAIPFHLATQEFVELARDRLEPGGAIAVNVIGALTGDGSRLLRSIAKTYRSVFPTVLVHPVGSGEGSASSSVRNVILVATERAAPARTFAQERWGEMRASSKGAPDLSAAFRDRWESPLRFDDVPILTDDYAPTDALLVD
jgi:spermidine synthase